VCVDRCNVTHVFVTPASIDSGAATATAALHTVKKYPYNHVYFVASFPYFNGNKLWARSSLFRRFTDTNVCGAGFVKMWKTRHTKYP